jgi:CRP-like cAMP-binding protein
MVSFFWDNIFRNGLFEDENLKVLRENYIFKELGYSELLFLRRVVHVRSYRTGEFIFRQGEAGVGLYILAKGSVDIHVNESSAQGVERLFVTRLQPGDFFGEISLVEENSRRTADASAHQETTLLGFFKPDLLEIVDRHPLIANKILWRLALVLSRRLNETSLKITELKRQVDFLKGQKVSL